MRDRSSTIASGVGYFPARAFAVSGKRVLAVDTAHRTVLDVPLEFLRRQIFVQQVADDECTGLGSAGGNDLPINQP